LVGGLGNQIFLLETAKSIAKLQDSRIYLNRFHIDRKHSKGKSTIEDFVLSSNIKYTRDFRFFSRIFIYLKKYLTLLNKIKQNIILVLDDTVMSVDPEITYRLVSGRSPKVIFIMGFWQNFDFWEVKDSYVLKDGGKRYLELSSRLQIEQPIVFHYRLGRLKNNWEHSWGALSPDFLINSLAALETLVKSNSPRVWIFSNDLEMARELLEHTAMFKHFTFEFIDDSNMSPAELLKLFAASKFLICSNSTFSLIAGKIGNVENVVVPAQLSKASKVDLNLPKDWLRINSSWLP
jgi:hypothetical protein